MCSDVAVLACDVFQDELSALGVDPARLIYLEMGLHDNPDTLREQVMAALARLESLPGVGRIALAYGLCGNGLLGVRAGRCPMALPRSHDCIGVLLGGADRHAKLLAEEPGTYFYSAGWIRGRRVPGPDREAHLREMYAGKYADDPEMIDELVEVDAETYAHHRRACHIETTCNPEAEAYTRRCAAALGWEFHRVNGDDSVLRDLIDGRWDAERFLVVPPGAQVAVRTDGTLFAKPA
jgi:hypothetical protein